MNKKLIIIFVAGFVIFTVVMALRDARQRNQRRSASSAAHASKMLNLDTPPPRLPER